MCFQTLIPGPHVALFQLSLFLSVSITITLLDFLVLHLDYTVSAVSPQTLKIPSKCSLPHPINPGILVFFAPTLP